MIKQQIFVNKHLPIQTQRNKYYSGGSDVLNFIGSDQKVAPYHLVIF